MSRTLFHLVTFGNAQGKPTQIPANDIWSEPAFIALKGHYAVIDKNNEIKEANLCNLFAPLGFDLRTVNSILVSDLNAFGTIRGAHAHQSYSVHLGQIFDPFDRQTKVANLELLLSDLDNQLLAYRQNLLKVVSASCAKRALG